MKLSWILVIVLLISVAIFSVQNAGVIPLHFLAWDLEMSAALALLLAAVGDGLLGLMVGVNARKEVMDAKAQALAEFPGTPSFPQATARAHDVFPVYSSSTPASVEERDST